MQRKFYPSLCLIEHTARKFILIPVSKSSWVMDEENIDNFIATFTDGYSLQYFKEICCNLHVSWGNFTVFIKTCTYLYLGCPINLGLPVFKSFQITIPSNPYQFNIHNSNSAYYCLIDSLTSKWGIQLCVCVCVCVFCAM
jgi:hypothetical protein